MAGKNGAEAKRRYATGRRIREWRVRRALSQAEVARASRITQASISNYETGKRDLPLATLIQVAGALEVPLGELLGTPEVIVVRDSELGEAVAKLARRPDLVSMVTGADQVAKPAV